jgi:hypothetical protein
MAKKLNLLLFITDDRYFTCLCMGQEPARNNHHAEYNQSIPNFYQHRRDTPNENKMTTWMPNRVVEKSDSLDDFLSVLHIDSFSTTKNDHVQQSTHIEQSRVSNRVEQRYWYKKNEDEKKHP